MPTTNPSYCGYDARTPDVVCYRFSEPETAEMDARQLRVHAGQRSRLLEAAPDMRDALKLADSSAGYGGLHDLISDLIERGLLTEALLPDDYQALMKAVASSQACDQVVKSAILKAGAH